jgi:hypothetical protein
VLTHYVTYYMRARTHLALAKDYPVPRAVHAPSSVRIVATPEVGGLHHRYERAASRRTTATSFAYRPGGLARPRRRSRVRHIRTIVVARAGATAAMAHAQRTEISVNAPEPKNPSAWHVARPRGLFDSDSLCFDRRKVNVSQVFAGQQCEFRRHG